LGRELEARTLRNATASPGLELVLRIGQTNACDILADKLERRATLLDLGKDGRMTLKYVLGKCGSKLWTGFIWLRIDTGGGLL
jgi:hypothetical protein